MKTIAFVLVTALLTGTSAQANDFPWAKWLGFHDAKEILVDGKPFKAEDVFLWDNTVEGASYTCHYRPDLPGNCEAENIPSVQFQAWINGSGHWIDVYPGIGKFSTMPDGTMHYEYNDDRYVCNRLWVDVDPIGSCTVQTTTIDLKVEGDTIHLRARQRWHFMREHEDVERTFDWTFGTEVTGRP